MITAKEGCKKNVDVGEELMKLRWYASVYGAVYPCRCMTDDRGYWQ